MEEIKSSGKVPCDPGWNDPPLFSYDSRAQTKSEKRVNILTKRVAFPMQSNSAINSGSNMPPPIDPTLPPQLSDLANLAPPPSMTTAKSKDSDNIEKEIEEKCDFNEEEALSEVMKNFSETLENRLDNLELQKKTDEIRKRLDVIRKLWEDKKFNVIMQQKILKLSEAIKSGDGEAADHLQRGLMVDHAALCSTWMSGVRHLLHAITATSSETSDEISVPL